MALRKRSLAAANPDAAPDALEFSIVIPVKDEADSIGPLIDEIAGCLAGAARFEVVCVDDGSRDGTDAVLRQAQARHPWLRVIRHAEPCGQSTATLTGVQRATADWIVTMDGDGQNPPGEIAKLLDARARAEDPRVWMVAGQREKRRDNWLRQVSSRIANGVRAGLLRDGVRDTGCSLKLFRRDAFLALPYFDHMHRFLPALVQRQGGRVVVVPVAHRPRERGVSKYGLHDRLWSGIADLLGVMWLQRRARLPRVVEADAPTTERSGS